MEDFLKDIMDEIAELLSDKDFIYLQKQFSRFNIFEVLRIKYSENKHSNILAWLFDSSKNHGLGSSFTVQFLYEILKIAHTQNQKDKINKVLFGFLNETIVKVNVYREVYLENKKRVDFQIDCCSNSGEILFIILIENKIYSKQGKKQLDLYLNDVEKKIEKEKIIPVYLTISENDEPKGTRKEEYIHITYNSIIEILEKLVVNIKVEKTNKIIIDFVQEYILLLKELMNMPTYEQQIAKELYKKYKNIIDFITENAQSSLYVAGNEFITENKNYNLVPLKKSNSAFFPFLDDKLKETVGGIQNDWREGAICGYFFLFDSKTGNLSIKIEVGPFEKSEDRQRFINILEEQKIEFNKSLSEDPKYTRIKYKYKKLSTNIDDITDTEILKTKMKELFDKTIELRKKLHECIDLFNN